MIVSGRAPLYGCLTGFVVKYECQHECGEVEVCKLVYGRYYSIDRK